MSRTIENRVVSMEFDNSNFEKNTSQTISSLDKLRESLNFQDTSRSMENLERSANNVNLSSLTDSITTVSDSFSALEVIAFSVLNNITGKAVNAGLSLAKSLTLDQVSSGFGKYESQVNSVQTILNAVEGSTIDQVTEKVDKLQWFADETSYSLSDMLSNVSKFTANEIGLEDAVSAMTGIANWAAVSGQNAEAASRAMYNLSQAIGVGALKLQDWKSIQNANMGTAEFKKTAMEIAANLDDEHKTLEYIGDGIYQTLNGQEVTIKTFDQTLSDAWLSKDVLMATLQKYSEYSDALYEKVQEFDAQGISITVKDAAKYLEEEGRTFGELGKKAFKAAQQAKTFNEAIDATKDAISSSFSRMFNNIFGNYEEAVKMWSGFTEILYDTFVAPFDEISSIIAQWHKLSYDSLFGFDEDTETYGAFFNFFYNLSDLLKPLKNAWESIFPSKTTIELAEVLKGLTDRFSQFVESLVLTTKEASYLKRAFKGLFAAFGVLKDTVKAIFDGFAPIGEMFSFLGEKFLLLGKDFGNLLGKLSKTSTLSQRVFAAVTAMSNGVKNAVESLVKYFEIFFEKFKQNGGTVENLKRILQGLGAAIDIVKNLVSALVSGVMQLLGPLFESAAGGAGAFAGTMFEGVATLSDYIVKLRDVITTNNVFGKAIGKIVRVIQDAIGFITGAFEKITGMSIGEFFEHVLSVVRDLFSYIGTFFESLNSGIVDDSSKSFGKAEEKIGLFETIFQGFGSLLKAVFQMVKDLAPAIKEVFSVSAGILSTIGKSIATLFKGIDTKQLTMLVKTGILVAVGLALVKFIGSLKKVTKIGIGLGDSVKGMFVSISGVFDAFKQKTKAESILIIAEAIGILAASLLVISSIDSDKLASSIVAIGAMFGLVIASMKILSKTAEESKKYIPSMVKLAMVMMMVSASILVLSLSIKALAGIKIGNLAAATFAIILLCDMMVSMVKELSTKTKGAKQGIKNVASLALAMNLLVPPILLLSLIPTNNLIKAIAGIGITMSMLAKISNKQANSKKLFGVALGMAALGVALLLMMPAMTILSKIEFGKIATSIAGIIGLVASVGVLSKIKVNVTNIAKLVLSMASVGIAAGLFAKAISSTTDFNWTGILKSTVLMISVIGLLILFSKLVSKVGVKPILIFVGIVGAISLAVLLLKSAMSNLSEIVTIILNVITTIMDAFSVMSDKYDFTSIFDGMMNLSKILLISSSVMGIAAIGFATFGTAAIILGTGLILLSKSSETLTITLETLISVIDKFLSIRDSVLSLAKLLGSAVVVFISEIILAIPSLVTKLIKALNAALPLILDSLYEMSKSLLAFLTKMLNLLLEFGKDMIPPIAELIVFLLAELLGVLDTYIMPIAEHLINIVVKIIDVVASKIDIILQSVINLVIKLIDALSTVIDDNAPKIIEAINKLLKSIISLILQVFGVDKETADNLSGKLMDGFNAFLGFITKWASKLLAILLDLISQAFGLLDGALEGFFNGGWKETWAKVRDFFTSLWDSILVGVEYAREKVGGFLDKVGEKIEEIFEKFRTAKKNAEDLGKNLIEGLREGIKNGFAKVGAKFEEAFGSVIDIAKEVFGIASPSKEFAKIGSFLDQGLGAGISDNTRFVTNSVRSMNDDVMDEVMDKKTGISAAISAFNESLNSEIDSDPVIRPVLDLTNIQNGSSQIAGMLNGNSMIDLRQANGMVQDISSQYGMKTTATLDNSEAILAAINGVASEIRDMNDQTFENTFNITGANPREIAQEVADIIQRQVERRTAVWA